MKLTIVHSTHYRYARDVTRSTQYIRLTPYDSPTQRMLDWHVDLPAPAVAFADSFGNRTLLLSLDRPHRSIELVARGRVEVADSDDGEPSGPINPRVFLRHTWLTTADDAILEFLGPIRRMVRSRPLIGMTDLMLALLDRMPYQTGQTTVENTAAQSFAAGSGVCQDHSHVFIACCRELGVPARYVSGYVHASDTAEVASHAWTEAWLTNRWVSFDVSNAGHAGGAHVKLAIGLDYLDACPVRGVRLGGGEEDLSTAANVTAASQ